MNILFLCNLKDNKFFLVKKNIYIYPVLKVKIILNILFYMKKYIFFFALSYSSIFANPNGMDVISGQVSQELVGKTLKINASDNAIINWNNFSIGKGETTQFVMPFSSSAVLNKVVSNTPSNIMGSLLSNGKVYLINPSGIIIGKDASINTSSFIASTYDIMNEAFLKGDDLLFSGDSKEKIINLGTIKAFDGDVILIGRQIDNKGKIEAKNGTVCIGAGKEILLKPKEKQKIFIKPSYDEDKTDDVGINNEGKILSSSSYLKADGYIYSLAINNTGTIDALSFEEEGGEIFLVAEGSSIISKGDILAKRGDVGGEVRVLGKEIFLLDEALVDVSNDKGGGIALFGGDYKGQNPDINNAFITYVSENVNILADSIEEGKGGKVILWADDATFFYGNISAKGGYKSGDGGFVEVSGGFLAYEGFSDLTAKHGKHGRLLLDPYNITISADPNVNMPSSPPFIPSGAGSTLSIINLENALMSSSVTISTSSGGGDEAGDITFKDTMTVAAVGSLTLNADRNIIINGGISFIGSDEAELVLCAKNVILESDGISPNPIYIEMINDNGLLINASNSVSMTGGDSPGLYSKISTASNRLIINTPTLNMTGGSANGAYVSVNTTHGGEIFINSGETLPLPGSLNMQSGTAANTYCRINTDENGGDIICVFNGPASITAGNLSGSQAGLYTNKPIIEEDGITFVSGDLTLTGGGDITSDASIYAGAETMGPTFIEFKVTDLVMTGGSAGAAQIISNGGDIERSTASSIYLLGKGETSTITAIDGDIDLTVSGAITMEALGAQGATIYAAGNIGLGASKIEMIPTNGDTIIESNAGNVYINNLSNKGREGLIFNTSAANHNSYIDVINSSGYIECYFEGDSVFTAGENSISGIFSGINSDADIKFYSGSLTINGGGANSKAGLITSLYSGTGSVNFTLADYLGVFGGTALGSKSGIYADTGGGITGVVDEITVHSGNGETAISAKQGSIYLTLHADIGLTSGVADSYISCRDDLTITFNEKSNSSIILYTKDAPLGGAAYISTTSTNPNYGHLEIDGELALVQLLSGDSKTAYIATDAGNIICKSGVAEFYGGTNVNGSTGIFTNGGDIYLQANQDLTINGRGAGACGIATSYNSGTTGDIIFEVGNLILTNKDSSKVFIDAKESITQSFANSILLDVRSTNDATIIGESVAITLNAPEKKNSTIIFTGENQTVNSPSVASIESRNGDINLQNVYSIDMKPLYGPQYIDSRNGGNIYINTNENRGGGGVTLNEKGREQDTYISTDNGGDIFCYFSGASSFTSGGDQASTWNGIYAEGGDGDVIFTSGDLTLKAGGGAESGATIASFDGNGDVTFEVDNLKIYSGTDAAAQITSSKSIINSKASTIYLESQGEGVGIFAKENISITMANGKDINYQGPIDMNNYGAGNGVAIQATNGWIELLQVKSIMMNPEFDFCCIQTIDGGDVSINSSSNPGTGGINLNTAGSDSNAYIQVHLGDGNVECHFSGASSFTAGDSSYCGVFTSGDGSINFSSGDLSIIGGDVSANSSAGLISSFNGGNGSITFNVNNLSATAGALGKAGVFSGDTGGDISNSSSSSITLISSVGAEAAISAPLGGIDITNNGNISLSSKGTPCHISCRDDLIFNSTPSKNTASILMYPMGGNTFISTSGSQKNIRINSKEYPGNVGLVFNPFGDTNFGYIATLAGGDINCYFSNTSLLRGGSVGAGSSGVFAGLTSGTGNIDMEVGALYLVGGQEANGEAAIFAKSGSVKVNVSSSNLDIKSGGGLNSNAYIKAENNDCNINIRGDLTIAGGDDSQAYIEGDSFSSFNVGHNIYMNGSSNGNGYIKKLAGEDFIISAGGNIFLNGAEITNAQASMTILAGDGMILENGAEIKNGTDSVLTLVVDNKYPSLHEMGHGGIAKTEDSTIATATIGGKARVFTSERAFNRINGNINSVGYVPGTYGIDTNYERWKVAYPNMFFGGPGFTIFYKNAVPIHHHTMRYASLAGAELFYMLDNLKINLSIIDYYDKFILRRKGFSISYFYEDGYVDKSSKPDNYSIKLNVE